MKTHGCLYVACMMAGLLVPSGIANAQGQMPPTTDEAWRTSLAAFGKAVVAVAQKSEITDASIAITHIRSYKKFCRPGGQDCYVIFKQGFGNEFHGNLATQFGGHVSWRGTVDSVETDAKEAVHVIAIKFPAPNGAPKGIKLPDTIKLRIPVSKLATARLPPKGSEFAFRGNLKKDKDDDEPFDVMYGIGAFAGEVILGVRLQDVEPIGGPKQPGGGL